MQQLTSQSFHVFLFSKTAFYAGFPTTRSNPITSDIAYIPIMAGEAKIVERRPTTVIPHPIAVTPKQLSITPIILTPLLYFVLSSFYLFLSVVNIFCISCIFLRRYICPSLPSMSSISIFLVHIFFSESNNTKSYKEWRYF